MSSSANCVEEKEAIRAGLMVVVVEGVKEWAERTDCRLMIVALE